MNKDNINIKHTIRYFINDYQLIDFFRLKRKDEYLTI